MAISIGQKLRYMTARLLKPIARKAPAGTIDLIHGPERRDALGTVYRPFRTFSSDGLALAGRDYGEPTPGRPPILCIPGLSRNARDFESLARRFSRGVRGKDRLIVVDLRGRGQSEYDDDANNYNPIVEAQDVIAIMDRLALEQPVIVGTSRGGLIAMMIGSMRIAPFAGVILNDIGPVIELDGLLKIKSYVGKAKTPETWEEAIDWVGTFAQISFPDLSRADHERMTRRLFRDVGGRPVFDYDPKLANGLEYLSSMTVLPQLWPQFATLSATPTLVIRGERSDILSEATVAAMAGVHPRLETHTVPAQGHAPLLDDDPTLDRIAQFLQSLAR